MPLMKNRTKPKYPKLTGDIPDRMVAGETRFER
jgi:hypothetical protein